MIGSKNVAFNRTLPSSSLCLFSFLATSLIVYSKLNPKEGQYTLGNSFGPVNITNTSCFETRPSKMEVYHRDIRNIIGHKLPLGIIWIDKTEVLNLKKCPMSSKPHMPDNHHGKKIHSSSADSAIKWYLDFSRVPIPQGILLAPKIGKYPIFTIIVVAGTD